MASTFHLRRGQIVITHSSPTTETTTMDELNSMLKALALAKSLIDVEFKLVEELRLDILRKKSAYRYIPLEILELIFLEAAEADTEMYQLGRTTTYPSLTFSQTCQVWRTLILNRPRLWSNFTIDLGLFSYRSCPVDLYLRRSKSHPLTIRVWFSAMDDHSLDQLRNLFSRCSQRLLRLDIDAAWWDNAFEEIFQAYPFPITKTLNLNLPNHAEYIRGSLLETFPALSSFRQPVGLAPVDIPVLGSLRSIQLDISNDYELFLRGCSQLETLSLINSRIDLHEWGYMPHWTRGVTPEPGQRVILRSLRKLYFIIESRQRFVADALVLIEAPYLDYLVIDATESTLVFTDWTNYENVIPKTWMESFFPFDFIPHLKTFFEHSSQALSTLELVGISISHGILIEALQHRPLTSLRTLIVSDTRQSLLSVYPVTEQLVVALTSISLLPGLMWADLWSSTHNENPPSHQSCLEMGQKRTPELFRRLTVSVPPLLHIPPGSISSSHVFYDVRQEQ